MSKTEVLYPAESLYRQRMSLDGLWYVQRDPAGIAEYALGVPKTEQIPVPGDWQDVYITAETQQYCGVCWYERTVFVPKHWLGQEVFLRLDGIGTRATVYINGVEVDRHEGMYTTAIVKLTRQIRYGQDNRITLRVSNESLPYQMPGGRVLSLPRGLRRNLWHGGRRGHSGLYGEVTLYAVPSLRITDIEVKTASISEEEAQLSYTVDVQGNCLVTITLRDREGRVVTTAVGGRGTLTVPSPHLWSLGDGYLYTLEADISRIGKQHDVYRQSVGIRQVHCENGNWTLNGKTVDWRAISVQDIWGHRLTYDAISMKRGLCRLQEMGGNCLITEGLPLPEEAFTLADQLGIAIIEEVPVMGLVSTKWEEGLPNFAQSDMQHRTLEVHQSLVAQCIRQHRHHPSLVGMSIVYDPVSLLAEDAPYMEAVRKQARALVGDTMPLGIRTSLPMDTVDSACLADFQFVLLQGKAEEAFLGSDVWLGRLFSYVSAWDKQFPTLALVVLMAGPVGFPEETAWLRESQWQQAVQGAVREVHTCPRVVGTMVRIRDHQFKW